MKIIIKKTMQKKLRKYQRKIKIADKKKKVSKLMEVKVLKIIITHNLAKDYPAQKEYLKTSKKKKIINNLK